MQKEDFSSFDLFLLFVVFYPNLGYTFIRKREFHVAYLVKRRYPIKWMTSFILSNSSPIR